MVGHDSYRGAYYWSAYSLFLFLGLGGVKVGLVGRTADDLTAPTGLLSVQSVIFISTAMGLSLLVTAWTFYRVSGSLFNPAITLALWIVGAITPFRATILVIAQLLGGIAGAALVASVTPGGAELVITSLAPGMSKAQGAFMEAFLTSMLVFAVLMLAAEKHKATYLAPVGIGLTLFVGQLFGTMWTGCGMNPARSFGPSVAAGSFPSEHWIYWIGPAFGSLIAVALYIALKFASYELAVSGQDADTPADNDLTFREILRKSFSRGSGHTTATEHTLAPQHSNGMSPDLEKGHRHTMRENVAHDIGRSHMGGLGEDGDAYTPQRQGAPFTAAGAAPRAPETAAMGGGGRTGAVFLFFALGGTKVALVTQTVDERSAFQLSNQTVMFISASISGSLFNPAITLALWIVGVMTWFRAAILLVAQLAGGITAAALVAALTPGGIGDTITKLAPGVSTTQGLFIEMFLTSMLVFVVLMLAAEKHKATFLAPIGIGLALFVGQLFGTLWTGCGMVRRLCLAAVSE
ncbi:hypothetical protein MNV49_003165 [Pseudohyphozyma bogoriensis]|nr:hypothetical protein MNV49_003165 [Pseudohyphozyma bogoriensis]